MPATYEPIATTTLGSAASSITFSSIAGTYTDLRVVLVGTAGDIVTPRIRFNSDSGTNYSNTRILGTGSSAASYRSTSVTQLDFASAGGMSTTIPHLYTMDVFSYAGSTYKTALLTGQEDDNGSGYVVRQVGLWSSTSAINTILLYPSSNNFSTGTTATLYGIKNA